jgi:microcystin-dependent protein
MSQPYLGSIMMFGGNFAIRGWQMCNGQTLSIQSYTALFSIIGTYYGGNGTTSFQLPNLQSRVPLHQGTGNGLSTYTIGQNGGVENVSLLYNQMPIHTHVVNAYSGPGDKLTPTGNVLGTEPNLSKPEIYSAATPNTTMNPNMIANAGGNVPFSVIQPYLCVTFLIAMVGIFPSRN